MPGTFKAYILNVEADTGKKAEYFWKMASKKGFVKRGKIAARHGEMLKWLKSKEVGLGHVRANAIILYIRLRANDPTLTPNSKAWAYETGYKEMVK